MVLRFREGGDRKHQSPDSSSAPVSDSELRSVRRALCPHLHRSDRRLPNSKPRTDHSRRVHSAFYTRNMGSVLSFPPGFCLFSHAETNVAHPASLAVLTANHDGVPLLHLTPAALFNSAISFTVKARNLPGSTSKTNGPIRTRRIFSTKCPTFSNILRICLFRPSIKTTSYQGFAPSSNNRIFAGEVFTCLPSSSSITIPARNRSILFSSGFPLTLTR